MTAEIAVLFRCQSAEVTIDVSCIYIYRYTDIYIYRYIYLYLYRYRYMDIYLDTTILSLFIIVVQCTFKYLFTYTIG